MAGCEPRIGIWYAELYWIEVHKHTPVIAVPLEQTTLSKPHLTSRVNNARML